MLHDTWHAVSASILLLLCIICNASVSDRQCLAEFGSGVKAALSGGRSLIPKRKALSKEKLCECLTHAALLQVWETQRGTLPVCAERVPSIADTQHFWTAWTLCPWPSWSWRSGAPARALPEGRPPSGVSLSTRAVSYLFAQRHPASSFAHSDQCYFT